MSNLYLRNILNGVFILLAIIAMVGVIISKSSLALNISYGVGLLAVLIKVIEVILRMPSMTGHTVYEQRQREKRSHNEDVQQTKND